MTDSGKGSKFKAPVGAMSSTSTASAAVIGAAAAVWGWMVQQATNAPRLWAGDGYLKTIVLPKCTLLQQPYRPSPVALNTHVQSVLGFVRGVALNAKYNRQLVICHDGGTVGLDWYRGCDHKSYGPIDTPILLVLHGINGGSHEGYCKWVCHVAKNKGWRAVVLNYRGCNGLPLTSPRGYAATLTHDVHYAITSIKARFPGAPVFAVGYSLGGLFLTKYLAEADQGLHMSLPPSRHIHGNAQQPDQGEAVVELEGSGLVAAAVVSSPVCLFGSSLKLGKPWTPGYLYNVAVAYKLREYLEHHRESIQGSSAFDVDTALKKWTVGEVEDVGIPRSQGFRTREEYYEATSSLQYIPHITTPTLFLMSEDDPFLGVLPNLECAANPSTVLAATSHGGHVAFLQGLWPFGPAYMDAAVLQFLDSVHHHYPLVARAKPYDPDSVPVFGADYAAQQGLQQQQEEDSSKGDGPGQRMEDNVNRQSDFWLGASIPNLASPVLEEEALQRRDQQRESRDAGESAASVQEYRWGIEPSVAETQQLQQTQQEDDVGTSAASSLSTGNDSSFKQHTIGSAGTHVDNVQYSKPQAPQEPCEPRVVRTRLHHAAGVSGLDTHDPIVAEHELQQADHTNMVQSSLIHTYRNMPSEAVPYPAEHSAVRECTAAADEVPIDQCQEPSPVLMSSRL